jgi:hypothetical protein
MSDRIIDIGVYPPNIDAKDILARLAYISECWAATRASHALEYAITTREAADRIASLEKALAEAREATIAECAKAYEAHDRVGREWIAGSLWDSLNREGAARVARLSTSNGGRG